MKGNVFSEVLVRGMSMLRHSWSWVLLHPQHLKNCIWAPKEWPPLLPGESRNYPTITQVKQHTVWLPHHRGNILPCSVALCLKFQVCVLQHHIFLHIYFPFAYKTAQLVLKRKVQVTGCSISIVFDLKYSTFVSHLWRHLFCYPIQENVVLAVLTPGKPIWFVPRRLFCLTNCQH